MHVIGHIVHLRSLLCHFDDDTVPLQIHRCPSLTNRLLTIVWRKSNGQTNLCTHPTFWLINQVHPISALLYTH